MMNQVELIVKMKIMELDSLEISLDLFETWTFFLEQDL